MRKSFLIAATILALSIQARGQQSQSPLEQPPPQSAGQASQKPSALAEAARKAREQKKNEPKPAKVFDNDNLPAQGGISSVGQATKAPADAGQTAGGGAAAAGAPAGSNEKAWRARFSSLRHKLDQDQQDLDVMQRELGVLDVQYYSDPVKGMQQQYTRSDINQKTAKIEAKKKQIEADKQAIADAEDELRRSGGDPGWAR